MAGLWHDWLSALRATGKGPVTAADGWPSAVRGEAWTHAIELAGNWTGATLEGTVRASPDAATALATFAVTGPEVAGGVSTFTLSLAAGNGVNSTGALPADGDASGEEEFPMMLRLTPSGGAEETLFGGLFTVIGKA